MPTNNEQSTTNITQNKPNQTQFKPKTRALLDPERSRRANQTQFPRPQTPEIRSKTAIPPAHQARSPDPKTHLTQRRYLKFPREIPTFHRSNCISCRSTSNSTGHSPLEYPLPLRHPDSGGSWPSPGSPPAGRWNVVFSRRTR